MFEPLTVESALNAAVPPARKPRVLVVDDAKYIRELLKMHLSYAGYEVETAEDAVEAGKRLLQETPDVIITDVNMPYMDGIEFVTAMREDRTVPDIPVIFITSRDDVDAEAAKLRVAACLTKPVRIDRLLEVLALYQPPSLRPVPSSQAL